MDVLIICVEEVSISHYFLKKWTNGLRIINSIISASSNLKFKPAKYPKLYTQGLLSIFNLEKANSQLGW